MAFSQSVNFMKMRKLKIYTFFVLFGFGIGIYTNAQSRDSLKISPIPLSEIATVAASDQKNTRDFLVHQIQAKSTDVKPQIDSLQLQVSVLKNLTDQILGNSSKLSYYNSLTQRWEFVKSKILPIHSELQKYSSKMEGIRDTLVIWQLKWEITLQETDPTPAEEIVSRILSIKAIIDSTTQILTDSLNNSIVLQNQITDLQVMADNYLQTIQELQMTELGVALLTK